MNRSIAVCFQNTCQLPAAEASDAPAVVATAENAEPHHERHRRAGIVWAKTLLLGEGDRPLLSGAAHVTVNDHVSGEQSIAHEQKSARFPEPAGIVYLPLPHPREDAAYNVTLDARDQYGRYCQSYCLSSKHERYQVGSFSFLHARCS